MHISILRWITQSMHVWCVAFSFCLKAFGFKLAMLDYNAVMFVLMFTMLQITYFYPSIKEGVVLIGGAAYLAMHYLWCWLLINRWQHSPCLGSLTGVIEGLVMTISNIYIGFDEFQTVPYASSLGNDDIQYGAVSSNNFFYRLILQRKN